MGDRNKEANEGDEIITRPIDTTVNSSREATMEHEDDIVASEEARTTPRTPTATANGPIWIAVSIQRRGDRGDDDDDRKPPAVGAIRTRPGLDRILRAAASQLRKELGLKKREVANAALHVTMNPDGEVVVSNDGNVGIEIESDDAAERILTTDGWGVTIVPDGEGPLNVGRLPDLAAAMAGRGLAMRREALDERRAVHRRERAEAEEGADVEPRDNPSTVRPVLFWRDTDKNGYLTNWAKSTFEVDGVRFSSAEQFIMHSKAALFDDTATMEAVLRTQSPKDQKRLGRLVRGFKDGVWRRHRRRIQLGAARAKFGQNPVLGERLLKTYPRPLAEASPSDTVYGIGLAPDDPRAQDPGKWRGENILGKVLEQVRDELRGEGVRQSHEVATS